MLTSCPNVKEKGGSSWHFTCYLSSSISMGVYIQGYLSQMVVKSIFCFVAGWSAPWFHHDPCKQNKVLFSFTRDWKLFVCSWMSTGHPSQNKTVCMCLPPESLEFTRVTRSRSCNFSLRLFLNCHHGFYLSPWRQKNTCACLWNDKNRFCRFVMSTNFRIIINALQETGSHLNAKIKCEKYEKTGGVCNCLCSLIRKRKALSDGNAQEVTCNM